MWDIWRYCFFLVLAVLGPEMGPDRPNLKSYSHITALQRVGTVPGPFRATFALQKKEPRPKIRILHYKAITVS